MKHFFEISLVLAIVATLTIFVQPAFFQTEAVKKAVSVPPEPLHQVFGTMGVDDTKPVSNEQLSAAIGQIVDSQNKNLSETERNAKTCEESNTLLSQLLKDNADLKEADKSAKNKTNSINLLNVIAVGIVSFLKIKSNDKTGKKKAFFENAGAVVTVLLAVVVGIVTYWH